MMDNGELEDFFEALWKLKKEVYCQAMMLLMVQYYVDFADDKNDGTILRMLGLIE